MRNIRRYTTINEFIDPSNKIEKKNIFYARFTIKHDNERYNKYLLIPVTILNEIPDNYAGEDKEMTLKRIDTGAIIKARFDRKSSKGDVIVVYITENNEDVDIYLYKNKRMAVERLNDLNYKVADAIQENISKVQQQLKYLKDEYWKVQEFIDNNDKL